MAELKELAESLGIVAVGGALSVDLVHEKSADMAATFAEKQRRRDAAGADTARRKPTELAFTYRPEMHKFDENASG